MTFLQQAKAKRRPVAESTERILAYVLGWKALPECVPTQGRVPAVTRRKQAMAEIPARPKPRLRTQRNPASLPLLLEPKLMTVSLGLRKRSIPSQKDSGQCQPFAITVTRSPLTRFLVGLEINATNWFLQNHMTLKMKVICSGYILV